MNYPINDQVTTKWLSALENPDEGDRELTAAIAKAINQAYLAGKQDLVSEIVLQDETIIQMCSAMSQDMEPEFLNALLKEVAADMKLSEIPESHRALFLVGGIYARGFLEGMRVFNNSIKMTFDLKKKEMEVTK